MLHGYYRLLCLYVFVLLLDRNLRYTDMKLFCCYILVPKRQIHAIGHIYEIEPPDGKCRKHCYFDQLIQCITIYSAFILKKCDFFQVIIYQITFFLTENMSLIICIKTI